MSGRRLSVEEKRAVGRWTAATRELMTLGLVVTVRAASPAGGEEGLELIVPSEAFEDLLRVFVSEVAP